MEKLKRVNSYARHCMYWITGSHKDFQKYQCLYVYLKKSSWFLSMPNMVNLPAISVASFKATILVHRWRLICPQDQPQAWKTLGLLLLTSLCRLIAWCGKPSDLWSDQGVNFRGGSKEFQEAFENIELTLQEQNIDFHFNPPRAPHFIGA